MNRRLRIIRRITQVLSLAIFVFLFGYLVYPIGWQGSILESISRLDPWSLFSQLRFFQTVPGWAWIPALTILATLILGRVFCGWICPFGAFLTLADRLGRQIARNKKLRRWRKRRLELMQRLLAIRHFWLLFLLVLFVFGLNLASSLTPYALFSNGIVRAFTGTVPWLLISFFVLTAVFGRLWCAVFCPTGILLSWIAKVRLLRFRTNERCRHCNQCAACCSVAAAPSDEDTAGEGCLVCGACIEACPAQAVEFRTCLQRQEERGRTSPMKGENPGRQMTRRQFLQTASVFVLGLAVTAWDKISGLPEKVLRPPGALPELSFKSICNRCGRCIKVCPNQALISMPLAKGIDTYETPYILARQANCCLCLSCQEVCPTGAIASVPVEQVKMGTAVIDKSRCLAWSQDKDCFICGEQCLRLAIQLEGTNRPVIQPDLCAGCGTCERNCPVAGTAAITVAPR
jgi:polyferredoxin